MGRFPDQRHPVQGGADRLLRRIPQELQVQELRRELHGRGPEVRPQEQEEEPAEKEGELSVNYFIQVDSNPEIQLESKKEQ